MLRKDIMFKKLLLSAGVVASLVWCASAVRQLVQFTDPFPLTMTLTLVFCVSLLEIIPRYRQKRKLPDYGT
jgi:hypothetical protein